MKQFMIKYKAFEIIVNCKNDGGRLVALSFNVFQDGELINSRISESTVDQLEAAIVDYIASVNKESYEH